MRAPFPVLLAALAGSLACQGEIDNPSTGPDLDPGERPTSDFCAMVETSPGRVTLHRLNRTEYDNTLRTLLFEDRHPGNSLPQDDESSHGFLNDADVLAVGTLLVEKYDANAQDLAARAVARDQFREAYLPCDSGRACAEQFVRDFGLRAFRRPVREEEVSRIADIIQGGAQGASFTEGVALGLRTILLSPSFLFRAEPHSSGIRALDSYEIASRLSYFLWQDMPDEELFSLAAEGALTEEATLRSELDRMIDHEKFANFFDGFVHRWLRIYRLEDHIPDEKYAFDEALRAAMFAETDAFIQHVITNDAPLTELLTADYGFLNERLATHYGVSGVSGDQLRRVDLGDQRGGLLTQGSVLTVTSHPDRTSPVQRGKWVLENLLCAPPADPPPDVDALLEPGEGEEPLTVRQRLEQHRENPDCAVCHDVMDPLGFAFENFDAVGMWRTEEDGYAIDATGELTTGESFEGVRELADILGENEDVTLCITQKLMAYALGRSLETRQTSAALTTQELCSVWRVADRAQAQGGSLRDIIEEMVVDDVFRNVGGRDEETGR